MIYFSPGHIYLMPDTPPALLQVVRYIHDNPKGSVRCEEIADSTGLTYEEVEEILTLLLERGVIKVFDGIFYTTRAFDRIAPEFISLYEDRGSKELLELTMRGALSMYSPLREDTLKKAMFDLGFSHDGVTDLIVSDIEKKYIKKVRAIQIGKIQIGSRLVPVGFYAELDCDIQPIIDEFLEYYRKIGFIEHFFQEEVLIGRYRPEMAQPAREHIKKKRIEVRNRLRISSPPILSSPGFLSLTYSSRGLHRDLLSPL